MIQAFVRAVALALLLCSPAQAEDPQPTCSDTAELALAPFVKALEAGLAGEAHHALETAKTLTAIDAYVEGLFEAQTLFTEARDAALAVHDRRIAAASKAINDELLEYFADMSEFKEARNAARRAGRAQEVADMTDYMAEFAAEHAKGLTSVYAPDLGYSRTVAGWKEFIASETANKEATAAKHAAGEVAVYVPMLGYSPTWTQAEALIAKKELERADTVARKNAYYLPSFGYSLDGARLDAEVQKRRDALADARARIADGSFGLYVAAVGYTTDRNAMAAAKAEAEAELARIRAGWGDGSYRNYNGLLGYTLSKADLDALLAEADKALADYYNAGDAARAYVDSLGYTTSGRDIKDALEAATSAEDKARWRNHLTSWQIARGEQIEALQEAVRQREEQMAEHHRIWLEDIAEREARIAGHYTLALAQTPCGGDQLTASAPETDPAPAPGAAPKPENDAELQGLLPHCTDPDAYQRSGGGRHLAATVGEFRAYLRALERANPTFDRRKLTAAFHAHFYFSAGDLNKPIPGTSIPLMQHGAETDGWQAVDLVCNVRNRKDPTPFPPHIVTLANGEEVDIAHVFAGMRADMNRSGDSLIVRDVMLLINTYAGDWSQVYFEDYTKFPMNQLRGDVMGIWLAQFYRLPKNRDVPLSQAFDQLFAAIAAAPGGVMKLQPVTQ